MRDSELEIGPLFLQPGTGRAHWIVSTEYSCSLATVGPIAVGAAAPLARGPAGLRPFAARAKLPVAVKVAAGHGYGLATVRHGDHESSQGHRLFCVQ